MICSKCNCEIPDNSKFCINCGATVSAPADIKKFCENCGLELPKGARFCAVCGAPVNSGAAAEVKPAGVIAPEVKSADVLAPVTLGAPVSAQPEVSPEKTAELSEKSVSGVVPAENVESGYSIPIPTSDVSMPAIDKAETPAPVNNEPWSNDGQLLWQASENKAASEPTNLESSAAGFIPEPTNLESSDMGFIPESNYSETPAGNFAAASYSVPAPSPVQTAPMDNSFANYGASAAAVAVKPIKKKNIAKLILIPVLSVIGAVLIAAGVIFFVNRSLFYSIILGKSGYAAMVEGNSIKSVTDKIDMGTLSDSIKTISSSVAGSYSSLASLSSSSSGITPMMSYAGSGRTMVNGFDAKSVVSSVNEAFLKAYGANSVKVTTDISAEITDSFKAQLAGMLNYSESTIDEIVKMVNEFGFVVDMTAEEKALEVGFETTAAGLKLNAKSIIAEDGKVYLMLPFVSDKAFMINIGSVSAQQAGQVSDVYLELDEKELKRITEKLVNVYLDVYKSCEITTENGEINVAGVTAKGKHITVNFTGSKMSELLKNVLEAIADDSYLCGKLSTFFGECGLPIDESQLKSTFKSMGGMINLPDSIGLVIETITDNSCRVLAKSYAFVESGKTVAKAAFAGDFDVSAKNGSNAAIAIEINEKTVFTADLTKTSDTDGNCNISVYSNDGKFTFKLKYSGLKEAKFCGNDTMVGTIEVGIDVPADFTEGAEALGEIPAIFSSAKLIVSVNVESENKLVETITLDVPQYGKISANVSAVVENKSEGISIPTDIIDITEIGGLSDGEIPEDLQKEAIAYLKDMKNAINSQNAGEIGNALAGALESAIDLAENGPKADRQEISNMMSTLAQLVNEVRGFDKTYGNENEELTAKANSLADKMTNLATNLARKMSEMTKKDFESYKRTFEIYTAEVDALRDEYIAATQGGMPEGPLTRADDIDFTGLDINELTTVLIEYESRYTAALQSATGAASQNASVQSAAAEATTAYETVIEDYENLYDVYNAGSLNLSLLRKCRKSAKTFAIAVEALESAVSTTI